MACNSNVLTNKSHKNSATISARGQNLTANATVELYENNPDITKSAEVIEKDENGNAKVIQYNVTVLGIEGDSIEITDEFNKEHLIYDAAQGLQVSYSDDGKIFTQDQSVTAGATSSVRNGIYNSKCSPGRRIKPCSLQADLLSESEWCCRCGFY